MRQICIESAQQKIFKQDSVTVGSGMNVYFHVHYYYDTGEANEVVSGLGYWS